MKTGDIPPGSTIAVISKGFLPDQIRKYMADYGRKQGYKYGYPYNHFEKVIEYDGKLVSLGARSKGAAMTPVDEYLTKHQNHLILSPVVPLSELEIRQQEAYAKIIVYEEHRKYQYGLLLAYLLWIKTNIKWLKQGDKRMVCYELVARFDNLVDRRGVSDLDLPTVYELIENKHFKPETEPIKFEI